jgi:hypothetical protein
MPAHWWRRSRAFRTSERNGCWTRRRRTCGNGLWSGGPAKSTSHPRMPRSAAPGPATAAAVTAPAVPSTPRLSKHSQPCRKRLFTAALALGAILSRRKGQPHPAFGRRFRQLFPEARGRACPPYDLQTTFSSSGKLGPQRPDDALVAR